jgi:PAS domain-containing protein
VDERAPNSPSNNPPAEKPSVPALGGAEEQHRLLMECVTDYAIFFLDPHGRVATWNAGAERIFGYAEAEIVGQPRSSDSIAPAFSPPKILTRGSPKKS